MKCLRVLCVLCGSVFPASALDREAFTFTKYDLDARVEPEQQRLGVRGKITLRNDSESAQKNLVLQISSTLNWSSIQVDGKPVEFVSQIYNSDIDHTGALTEAIVTLPHPVGPKQAIELEVGYEGIIPVLYSRTRDWVRDLVSGGNRGSEFVRREQRARRSGQVEAAGSGSRDED